jgi:hypothetical protein
MLAEIGQLDPLQQRRGRRRKKNLAAVAGRHHPGRPVQGPTEIIPVPQLRRTGGDPDPHRQPQTSLRLHCRRHRVLGQPERGAHPVAGVLEHDPAMTGNGRPQDLIVRGQLHRHGHRVVLPASRRRLDIGKQKRHHSRRQHDPPHSRSPLYQSTTTAGPPLKLRTASPE